MLVHVVVRPHGDCDVTMLQWLTHGAKRSSPPASFSIIQRQLWGTTSTTCTWIHQYSPSEPAARSNNVLGDYKPLMKHKRCVFSGFPSVWCSLRILFQLVIEWWLGGFKQRQKWRHFLWLGVSSFFLVIGFQTSPGRFVNGIAYLDKIWRRT